MFYYPFGAGQQLNLDWIIKEIIDLHKRLDPDWEGPTFNSAFPFTNLSELNLDWILRTLKELQELVPEEDAKILKMVANALIAATYDETKQYNPNDIVYRDEERRLYKCVVLTPVGGEDWNPDHWEEITLNEDITKAIRGIRQISEIIDLYDPAANYRIANNQGAPRTGYTIAPDGKITVTQDYSNYGSAYLFNDSLLMKAGTYRIKAHVSTSNLTPIRPNALWVRVGLSSVRGKNPVLTTTESGETPIESGDNNGWFDLTFVTDQDETFCFLIMPLYDDWKPLVIDNLTIEGITAYDGIARRALTAINWVTPEQFGAVGDGASDDTSAFTSAIATGKPILLGKAKTYLITDTLTLTDNALIVGENASVLKFNNLTGSPLLGIDANTTRNVRIENVTIDFSSQASDSRVLDLHSAMYAKIINCTFQNLQGTAIYISDASDITIESCKFSTITGIASSPGECIFGTNPKYITITQCECNNIGDHFVYIDGANVAEQIIISECILQSTGSNGLTNGAAIALYSYCKGCSIINCVIKQCRSGIFCGEHGASNLMPQGISIIGCSIQSSAQNGITLRGKSGYPVHYVSITGCTCDTSGQDNIEINYGELINISNCLLHNPGRAGFACDSLFYSLINNCLITSVRSGKVGMLIGSGRGGNSGGTCTFSNIQIESIAADAGYPVYHRRGAGYTFENITEIGAFSNKSVYVISKRYNANYNTDAGRSILFTDDIAEATYHNVGDIVFVNNASSGNPLMYVCTTAGTPGTLTAVVNVP